MSARRSDGDREPGRLLIVSGDDFGLTDGINRGILEAHERGVLTSTSVIAPGPTLPAWVSALDGSGIDTGVHLTCVGEDPPLLSAPEIPSLVDDRGFFPTDWRMFLRRAAVGRIDAEDLRRELDAQIRAVRDAGIHVTHVDTHQHLHLWPTVTRVVLDLAADHGIHAARVPQAHGRTFRSTLITALEHRLRRRVSRSGVYATDGFIGLEDAGAMTLGPLRRAITRAALLPGSSVELCMHPGETSDPLRDRYRWGYRWSDELEALRDPSTRVAIRNAGFRPGTFADLVAGAGHR